MFRSVRVGKLFGIPLFIHPTFLLLPAWVAFNQPPGAGPAELAFLMTWVLVIFGCIVLHELGHALCARAFGIGTRDITLYPIGGVARLERMSEKPSQELLIALAGPAVNLVITLLLSPVILLALLTVHGDLLSITGADLYTVVVKFLTLVALSNLGLFVFNLLPCFPMDGGRVLRALLSLGLGHLRATEIAVGVGFVMALAIAALAVHFQQPMTVVLAVFVVFAGQMELRSIRWREAQRRAGLEPQPRPLLVPEPVVLGSNEAPPPELGADFSGYTWHRDFHVWVLWRQGRPVAFWRNGAAE
jgi:Zn-dependent protease